MEPNEREKEARRSTYERLTSARKWIWNNWTDEAVMIYRRSAQGKTRARIMWVEFLLFLREVIREFILFGGTARAASLAYTTLLSLVPLLVALSQILRSYFAKIFPDFRVQLDSWLNVLLPYQAGQIAYHINRFMENAEAASTLGIIAFIFISFRLFMAVEAAVNEMWKVEAARGYRQKLRAFTMLLFWGPLLIGLSFTTSNSLQRNPYLRAVTENAFILDLVPIIVLFIAFTMLFWLVPARPVRLKSAVLGAVVTALLFQLVRYGFGAYAQHLFTGRLNVIYGTLGLVIIFLIALETMWVVILLGVEVSYVHQNLEGILRASEQQIEDNPRLDLYFALAALIDVSRRFEKREDAPSSYRLAQEFGATDQQMLRILRRLEDAKLVKEIGGDWTGFAPGCDPDRITVEEVIRVMEGGGREAPAEGARVPSDQLIRSIFSTLQECTAAALGQTSIGFLVRKAEGRADMVRERDYAPEEA